MNATTKIANCAVLDTNDGSHVTRQTPLDRKRAEIQESSQYRAIDKQREKSTASKRKKQDSVRPL